MAAWATVADALNYTGKAVTITHIDVAQGMIEALIRRVYRATDAEGSSNYWLSRAVAWQASYVAAHPEITTLANVQQMSQDGFSVTFAGNQDNGTDYLYSPVALRCLDNLYRGANTTIRMNSAFQRSRPSTRWRAI